MLIQNQVVMISGGASGLGLATALHFHQLGANVIVVDRDQERLQQVQQQHGLTGFAVDVTCEEDVNRVFATVMEDRGGVQVLVNCAGVVKAERMVGRSGTHSLQSFSQVLDVNVSGTFNLMRVASAAMVNQQVINDDNERGVIINTSSVAAFEGQVGQVAYSASKGAVASMTLPAARELARFGIRVMCIAPGIMHTPMMAGMPQEVQDGLHASVPFPKRMGLAVEFARLAEHIVTNGYLNGDVIRLDGAIRLGVK